MKKMIIALALVICQLIVPISAAAEPAQAPAIDFNNCNFIDLCTITGTAYLGGWYKGVSHASTGDDDLDRAFAAAEADFGAPQLPAPWQTALGYRVLGEVMYSQGVDITTLTGLTSDKMAYNDVCTYAYIGYMCGYSYGYDENYGSGDTSGSFDWVLDEIQKLGQDECISRGANVLDYLAEYNYLHFGNYSYSAIGFGAACAYQSGWSMAYDMVNSSNYTNADILDSFKWAADWINENPLSDVIEIGQLLFEFEWDKMGKSTDGLSTVQFTVDDFFFVAGIAAIEGYYDQAYNDEDGTQAAADLLNMSEDEIITYGLDFFSQFALAYLEGRVFTA